MAHAYVTAMEHAEWQARKVIKKYHKNRPLGHIETQHRYMSPQPVLSCRSIDIDACGTRTYRAKSSDEILSDQHKFIHEIYSQAKNLLSTPAPPQTPVSRTSTSNSHVLRSLQIDGQGANRRITSAATTSFSKLQPRGSAKSGKKSRAQSAIAEYIYMEDEPMLQENAKRCHTSSNLIKETWKKENRTLDQGKFVRGKQNGPSIATSLHSGSVNSWMSFGGGQSEHASGLIDAFTGMRASGNFGIDGTTGIAVTKHLHKGDKIHVGRNGSPLPYMAEDQFITNTTKKPEPTYFSMDDLISFGNVKVLAPSKKNDSDSKPVKAEVKTPVVFYRLGELEKGLETSETSPKFGKARYKEAYTITQRKSARKNIDGTRHRPSSDMVHLSIEKTPPVHEEDINTNMHMRVASAQVGTHLYQEVKQSVQKFKDNPIDITAKAQVVPAQQSEGSGEAEEDTELDKAGSSSHIFPEFPVLGKAIEKEVLAKRTTSPEVEDRNDENKRPMSSSVPRVSLDGNLVSEPASLTMGMPKRAKSAGVSLRQMHVTGYRNNSRPPPLKPSLHKTTAAAGASFKKPSSQNGTAADTEFIQIHQQMSVNTDQKAASAAPRTGITNRQRTGMAVDSVSEHNKPETESPKPIDLTLQGDFRAESVASDNSHANSARASALDTGRDTPTEDVEDMKYAFEIPTGQVESDITLSYTKQWEAY